jgi:hypothetical protein
VSKKAASMAWRLAQVCTYIIVITRFYLYAIGIDCHKDHALGLVNVTEAAHLGSDVGQLLLGKAFAKGLYGLSKDPVRARFWLEKTDWEEAKELLQELGH